MGFYFDRKSTCYLFLQFPKIFIKFGFSKSAWNSALKLWKFLKNRFLGECGQIMLREDCPQSGLCIYSATVHDPHWGFKTTWALYFINLVDQRVWMPRFWEKWDHFASFYQVTERSRFLICQSWSHLCRVLFSTNVRWQFIQCWQFAVQGLLFFVIKP